MQLKGENWGEIELRGKKKGYWPTIESVHHGLQEKRCVSRGGEVLGEGSRRVVAQNNRLETERKECGWEKWQANQRGLMELLKRQCCSTMKFSHIFCKMRKIYLAYILA